VKTFSPNKLIINAAITGTVLMEKDTPYVPLTVKAIVQDAVRCCASGASVLHVHARDEKGVPTCNKEIYGKIIRQIREKCPAVIICASTSGRMFSAFEQRSAVLALKGAEKPDMASLTLGSLNFAKQVSVTAPEMIEKLALKMRENGIVPELEVFEPGMINAAKVFIKRGVLAAPFYFNILLGSVFSVQAKQADLNYMVSKLPEGVPWGAAGIGRAQLPVNFSAMMMGGHVRVGLEDNIYYDRARKKFASNEMLIRRIVRLAEKAGRDIASPGEARDIIGLGTAPG